jgi:hypothetical protein
MPFQLSPGVAVVEKDFTSIIPSVATSPGAFAGVFQWGPVLDPLIVTSENVLAERFGKPNSNQDVFSSFFTAANFLSYTNNLLVVRADTANQKNASCGGFVSSITTVAGGTGYHSGTTTVAFALPSTTGGTRATGTATVTTGTATAALSSVVIAGTAGQFTCTSTTLVVGDTVTITGTLGGTGTITGYTTGKVYTISVTNGTTSFTLTDGGSAIVTTAGTPTGLTYTRTYSIGGVVSITITNPGTGYTTAPAITVTDTNATPGTGASFTAVIQTLTAPKIKNVADYQSTAQDGQLTVGPFAAKFPGTLGNSLSFSVADSSSFSTWEYKDSFDTAPGTSSYASSVGGSNDEMHIIVIDDNGAWTGTAGSILEKYAFVSKASDVRKSDGTNNYYKNVINSNSRYLWWTDHPVGLTTWGTAATGVTFETLSTARTMALIGGADDFAATQANYQEGFALFANDELYDIALIPTGRVTAATVTYVINNIAEVRKDCIVFASPVDTSDASIIVATGSTGATKMTTYRDTLPSTSYAVLDSGYKYQYDRYNDAYRYIPLNGDIAGLCARTDYTNDPWFSPGGMNRGQVKNVVRLAYNPSKTDRDTLYKKGVNPVVAFPGQGTVLFGDKTLLAAPSAFDRINVRRLFIVLEKSVATAAKFQLFEFNDGFTRAQFKNLIEPFLRDVQGRRGITDFRVKCDDTNNTGEVIDRNEFVADIFIKPNRSINFITLNFVAARSSISFNEVGA